MGQGERLEWVDLAKGICMLLVVAGHLFWASGDMVLPQYEWLDNCMTTFRMPLYFVLCGIFFKTYHSFGEFLRRKTNNLLVPFIVFFAIACAVGVSSGFWFLGCLFEINILGYGVMAVLHRWMPARLRQYSARGWFLIPAFLVFSLCCGWVGQYCHMEQWIDVHPVLSGQLRYAGTSVVALPFFLLGYLLRTRTHLFLPSVSASGLSILVALSCMVVPFALGWAYEWPISLFVYNQYEIPMPIVYLCGMFGTMGILLLARWAKRIPVVSYIGRYSIIVLLTQTYLIYVANFVERRLFGMHGDVLYWCLAFVIVLLLEVPVIWVCKRYLPYIFAQKRIF